MYPMPFSIFALRVKQEPEKPWFLQASFHRVSFSYQGSGESSKSLHFKFKPLTKRLQLRLSSVGHIHSLLTPLPVSCVRTYMYCIVEFILMATQEDFMTFYDFDKKS